MSEKDLRALLDHASKFCDGVFNRCGEISPMWHAVQSSGKQFIELHPQQLGKDMASAMIRAQFDLMDVVRYVYIGEAWTVSQIGTDHSEVMRYAREQRLHEYPGRIEIVQVQGEDAACGQIVGQRRIIRPPGKKPYLGALELTIQPGDGGASEGRLIGMLPKRGRMQ